MAQDFSSASKVLIMIQKSVDADHDMREKSVMAKRIIAITDAIWDERATKKMANRFRGNFDLLSPMVDGISGEISKADFTMRVSPSGGSASMDTAKTIEGLIRNIRNISSAEDSFSEVGRSNVICGFDCVEVLQEYVDGDSFDQDLMIDRVPNALDSVWFDTSSVKRDRSDANWSIKKVAMTLDDYNDKYPEGSGQSIGGDSHNGGDKSNKDTVTVGRLYYRKAVKITLVVMSDGKVYQEDDNLIKVKDELAAKETPITIAVENGKEMRRVRDSWKVFSRMIDGSDWLDEEQETVFYYQPLIPVYGNYDIVDGQCIYYGAIDRLLDHQRVLNYAMSRDIEDGALSPSPFIWMTPTMRGANDYSGMNMDRDAVREFDPDPEFKGMFPQQVGGPQASQGLQTTIANMQQSFAASSNTFNAQQGNANPNQSGIAGEQQIEQGNIGSIKWFKAQEVMLCQVARVIMTRALSLVYGSTQQRRIVAEDGTGKMVMLNETVLDDETGEYIKLNDLSVGEYGVVCEAGAAFSSAQKEAVRAFETMAAAYPEVAAGNMDIWLKNKKEPGFDLMAERERVKIFNAGLIPETQWTDEERAQVQQQEQEAANQPPQEEALMVAARAEETKAQVQGFEAETKRMVENAKAQNEAKSLEIALLTINLKQSEFDRASDDKFNVDAANIDQGQQALDLKEEMEIISAQQNQQKLDAQDRKQEHNEAMQQIAAQQKEINDAFANLKTMKEAMGVDTIVGPHSTKAYIEQAAIVDEVQDDVDLDIDRSNGEES